MRTLKMLGVAMVLFISMLLIQSCDNTCDTVTCQNGGECTDGVCSCPSGYTGDLCQYADCSIVQCPTNSTCEDDPTTGEGLCVCDAGYDGDSCQIQCRTKFVGAYNVDDSCTSGTYAYASSITTSVSGVTTMVISNFGGFNVNINAVLDDCDTFSIPQQTDASNRIFVSTSAGTRNATTGQFSFTYHVTFTTDNTFDDCDPVFTPQ